MLNIGDQAPDFSLEGDDGQIHSLKDYQGSPLVLFFYPKDLTPGCTTEACDFSTAIEDFGKLSAQIIGISKDSLASHARFKSKYGLNLLLLSDPELAVHHSYKAYSQKFFYGKGALGVIRSSFLLDEEGKILRAWYKVRVKNHVQAVLEALKKYAEGGSRTRKGIPGRF